MCCMFAAMAADSPREKAYDDRNGLVEDRGVVKSTCACACGGGKARPEGAGEATCGEGRENATVGSIVTMMKRYESGRRNEVRSGPDKEASSRLLDAEMASEDQGGSGHGGLSAVEVVPSKLKVPLGGN